jgi:iron complex transport system substrate-binding protein
MTEEAKTEEVGFGRFIAIMGVIIVFLAVWPFLFPSKNVEKPVEDQDGDYWSKSTLYPCGEVTLKEEPKRIVTFNHNHNDMLETFSYGDRVIATGYPKSFYYSFYKQLPGFDWKVRKENPNLKFFQYQPAGVFDKELFYSLDADIHHIDPNRLARMKGWSVEDVNEIATNIAPFFDNNATMLGDDAVNRNWGVYSGSVYYSFEDYTRAFYKLYNQVQKGEDLLFFIHSLEDKVKTRLKDEYRPRVAILRWKGNEITRVGINSGIEHLQYRTLGVRDAFKGLETKVQPKVEDKSILMGRIDLEGLLAIDPDVMIMPYIIYTFENDNHIMTPPWKMFLTLKDDPVGQKLSAFKNNRVYPGGILMQGPIFYCFQLEMAAKQIYPYIFGEYHQDNIYKPEEQLFSRDDLARILR